MPKLQNHASEKRAPRKPGGQVATALFLFLGISIIGVLAIFAYETSRILLVRDQLKTCADIAALSGETTLLSSSQNFQSAQASARNTALNMLRRNSILGIPITSITEAASKESLRPSPGNAQVYFEFIDPVTGAVGSQNSNVLRVHTAYSYPVFGGQFMGIGNTVYTVAVTTKAALPSLDIYMLLDLSSSMDDQTPVTSVLRSWDPAIGPEGSSKYSVPNTAGGGAGVLSNVFCGMVNGNPVNGLPPHHLDVTQQQYALACNKCFSELQQVNNPTAATSPLRGLSDDHPPGDTPPAGGVGIDGLQVGYSSNGNFVGGNQGRLGSGNQAGTPGAPNNPPTPLDPTLPGPGFTYSPPPGNTPPNPSGYGSTMTFRPKSGDKYDPLFLPNTDNYRSRISSMPALRKRTAFDTNAFAQGTPGGGVAGSYPQCTFTHLIVNLNGGDSYSGTSNMGFNFPNLGSVVEASLGNLETTTTAKNACVNLSALGVQPKAGYQDAYKLTAAQRVEPLSSVTNCMGKFVNKIRYSTDPHFGLVTFSYEAGNNPQDTLTDWNVSWAYPQGGVGNFPIPGIHVSQSADNFNSLLGTITPSNDVSNGSRNMLVAFGGANVAMALSNALNHLDPNGGEATTRPGATRAIVLVTDGLPTVDLNKNRYSTPPPDNEPALSDARAQAIRAKQAGIPIYVVALSQQPDLNPHMDSTYSDTEQGGIAYESGQGAKYYRVAWNGINPTRQELDRTFGNIARQLVNLVK